MIKVFPKITSILIKKTITLPCSWYSSLDSSHSSFLSFYTFFSPLFRWLIYLKIRFFFPLQSHCIFFAYFNQRPIFQVQNFNFLFFNFNQNTSLILQLLHSLFSPLFPILIVYYLFLFSFFFFFLVFFPFVFFFFFNMNDLYCIKVRQIWGSTPYWVIYDYKIFYFSIIFPIYHDNFFVIFTIIDRLLFMWLYLFIYLFIILDEYYKKFTPYWR